VLQCVAEGRTSNVKIKHGLKDIGPIFLDKPNLPTVARPLLDTRMDAEIQNGMGL